MAENGKLDTLQRVELAEGVEIQLRTAGPVPRALAFLLDALIRIAIYIPLAMVAGGLSIVFGDNVGEGFMLLAVFTVEWFYNVIFEAGRRGATPGKRAMGLRVVADSGAPATTSQAVIRNFLRFADFLPFGYAFGLATCSLTRRFQRLGDLAAGTVVVYTEPAALPLPSSALEGVVPAAPAVRLTREEQWALLSFAERSAGFSEARAEELSDHARGLTRTSGAAGRARLLAMAAWLQQAEES